MQEIEEQKLVPIEEQISQELVKANVTEAIIADLKERYLPLKINGIEDKETYLIVKEARKECKALRILAKKICEKGREEAVATQKAWISKQNDVTGRIGEVEDYLEKQENDYEAQVAKEKEERKRKQEEQYILRQQALTSMGALYSDGSFSLGSVSFELSLIKESEVDIWEETILPKFKEEHEKIKSEEIEKERIKAEQEAELKRQQEELEAERKRLSAEADRLKAEKDRQEQEAAKRRSDQFEFRSQQLKSIGFDVHGVEWYVFREFKIAMAAVWDWDDNAWGLQLVSAKQYVEQVLAEEAEEKRKEQEIKDLQNKRYSELFPYSKFGDAVTLDTLWKFSEGQYLTILAIKKSAYEKSEEEKAQKIAEDAARKERERIEEEQRKEKEIKRLATISYRVDVLKQYGSIKESDWLGDLKESEWDELLSETREEYEETIRKQEEERKAEELAQASDKVKWADLIEKLDAIEIHTFKSSQYRKKAAILREKLEEIKAL